MRFERLNGDFINLAQAAQDDLFSERGGYHVGGLGLFISPIFLQDFDINCISDIKVLHHYISYVNI
jgi:hypothetical protein